MRSSVFEISRHVSMHETVVYAYDFHVWVHIDKNCVTRLTSISRSDSTKATGALTGRVNVIPFSWTLLSAEDTLGAILLAGLDVGEDLVVLHFGDLRRSREFVNRGMCYPPEKPYHRTTAACIVEAIADL